MHLSKLIALLAFALLIVLAACGSPPTPTGCIDCWPPRRTLTPVPRNDEEAIRQTIDAEGEATGREDIDRLQGIWATDAVVTDAETGSTWRGWKSILDRYNNIVWPSNPGRIIHPSIRVTITSNRAVALSDTNIGTTTRKDNDRWTLEKRGGKWQITSLTFGLSR